jgi:TIR domain
MAKVFVSHCSEDDYFVDFLVELLEFHYIDVWVDRSNLQTGGNFPKDIEQALANCDAMIVVISQHSSRSHWITREITQFRAVNADRLVIPLVLDAKADPDKIYEGLGLTTQLRCYESYLESFQKLLQTLGHSLFPHEERRKETDRRSKERRRTQFDRRNPVRRLRSMLYDYVESTGRDLLKSMESWREVDALVAYLMIDGSPFQSFNFADRKTGVPASINIGWLRPVALESWRRKSDQSYEWGFTVVPRENITGAAYIIDDIVAKLDNDYIITSRDRRSQPRRSGASRRKDQDLSERSGTA